MICYFKPLSFGVVCNMALDSNISLQGAIFIEEATIGEVVAATAKEVAVPRSLPSLPRPQWVTLRLPVSC